jgi:hypothetical protein
MLLWELFRGGDPRLYAAQPVLPDLTFKLFLTHNAID